MNQEQINIVVGMYILGFILVALRVRWVNAQYVNPHFNVWQSIGLSLLSWSLIVCAVIITFSECFKDWIEAKGPRDKAIEDLNTELPKTKKCPDMPTSGYQPTGLDIEFETKVKLFHAKDINILQDKINEWLIDYHKYVKQFVYQDNITVMIVYRKQVKLTPPSDD